MGEAETDDGGPETRRDTYMRGDFTPLDLPKAIKQGALTLATFGYDGEQRQGSLDPSSLQPSIGVVSQPG